MNRGLEAFSLLGKTALVTGATGHLGSAIARALGRAGAHVLVNSRSLTRSQDLTQALTNAGCSAEPAVFDVTDKSAVADFFFAREPQALHILVNNAYLGGIGNIEMSGPQAYTDSYNVAVVAVHNLVIFALPSLRKAVQTSGDASVINLASMYGMISPDQRVYESPRSANPPFYGAAKAALLQWTRYAACEFGTEGIRVNSISPGPFPNEAVLKSNPKFIQALATKVPLARIGRADEVAGPVLFLASAAASFVNGANLMVDGGWTSW